MLSERYSFGEGGHTWLCGSEGQDAIAGKEKDVSFYGATGDDTLRNGGGNDPIEG